MIHYAWSQTVRTLLCSSWRRYTRVAGLSGLRRVKLRIVITDESSQAISVTQRRKKCSICHTRCAGVTKSSRSPFASPITIRGMQACLPGTWRGGRFRLANCSQLFVIVKLSPVTFVRHSGSSISVGIASEHLALYMFIHSYV